MFALPEGEEGLKISILSQSIFSNMNIFLSCGHLWWFFCLTLEKKRQKRNKWLQQICEKSVVIFLFCCRNRLGKITELKGKKIVHCKSQGHHRLVLACMLEWAEKPKIQQPIHNPAYRLFRGKIRPPPAAREAVLLSRASAGCSAWSSESRPACLSLIAESAVCRSL